jgi:uncharacterized membrane protein YqiK
VTAERATLEDDLKRLRREKNALEAECEKRDAEWRRERERLGREVEEHTEVARSAETRAADAEARCRSFQEVRGLPGAGGELYY